MQAALRDVVVGPDLLPVVVVRNLHDPDFGALRAEQLDEAIRLSQTRENYRYVLEEAEILAARDPEIPGAKEMFHRLKEESATMGF